MTLRAANPLLGLGGLLLIGLSLSIGWGIRGNYGHETGAMLPGALAAIAICVLSAREDWRQRLAYFALFGAIGWSFGGSISYMQVIGYTHSGHLPSQVYGFAGLFLIGFLWAAFGGAGTALPAVLDRRRLTEMFWPLSLIFLFWVTADIAIPILSDKLDPLDGAMKRHESAIYWLDSDWLQISVMLVAILLYDLCERRLGRVWELVGFGLIGAGAGWLLQRLLGLVGLSGHLWNWLVRPQGVTSAFPAEDLITNWPSSLPAVSPYLGSIVGVLLGITIYFARRGRFAHGSGLFLSMAVGWLLGFLILPVLLGIRLTPPRGDNWAGLFGAVIGLFIFLHRQGLHSVILATLVTGTIGGLGFSGIALVKLIAMVPGNPAITSDPEMIAQWKHWQSANWHSFLEQSYGFVNGIGVAVALGLLLRRCGPLDDTAPRRRWTELAAIAFVVPVMLYYNMVKNVDDWTSEVGGTRSLPEIMRAPLFGGWEMSAWGWFHLFFGIAAVAFLLLLVVHLRRPLAILPANWVGRGQLLYFLILWCFVLGNFAKALTSFREGRLLTEGVIIFHAVVVTILILLLPRTSPVTLFSDSSFRRPVRYAAVALVVCILAAPPLMTMGVRHFYGDAHSGHSGQNFRFGDKANWKTAPLLRGTLHR